MVGHSSAMVGHSSATVGHSSATVSHSSTTVGDSSATVWVLADLGGALSKTTPAPPPPPSDRPREGIIGEAEPKGYGNLGGARRTRFGGPFEKR